MTVNQLVRELLRRAVLLVFGLPLLLLIAYVGGWLLAIVILGVIWIGLSEYYTALYCKGWRPAATLGFVGSFLVIAPTQIPDAALSWMFTVLAIVVLVAFSLIGQVIRQRRPSAVIDSATTVFGVMYVALMMSFLLRLRGYDLAAAMGVEGVSQFAHRLGALLLVVVPIPFLDTCAFVAGNLWGRHKLAPAISPGKTVEGAVGGFLGCVAMTVLVGWLLHLPLIHSLSIGTLMGVIAQVGDLGKSALKRDIGIKDFGSLLGPHGGVIDRFDGMMFAMPVVYLYLLAFVGMPGL